MCLLNVIVCYLYCLYSLLSVGGWELWFYILYWGPGIQGRQKSSNSLFCLVRSSWLAHRLQSSGLMELLLFKGLVSVCLRSEYEYYFGYIIITSSLLSIYVLIKEAMTVPKSTIRFYYFLP